MVAHILFDIDNTLYPASSGVSPAVDERMVRFIAEYLDMDVAAAAALRETKLRRYDHTLTWLMADFHFTAIESFMAYVHDVDLAALIPLNPALKDLLGDITLPKSILTNAPVEHALRVLEHLGIQEAFQRIFDTRYHHFRVKPNPAVYRDTLAALQLEARQVLFIDDGPHLLSPFQAMGGQVLWVAENGTHGAPGLPAISGIMELPAALNSLI